MIEWYNQLPEHFKQITIGLLVVLIWEIVKLLYKISAIGVTWSSKSRKQKITYFEELLLSSSASKRTEGSVEYIFLVLRYLFIGNLLWLLPEVLGIFNIWIWGIGIFKLFGIGYFVVGLGWVLKYLQIKKI